MECALIELEKEKFETRKDCSWCERRDCDCRSCKLVQVEKMAMEERIGALEKKSLDCKVARLAKAFADARME